MQFHLRVLALATLGAACLLSSRAHSQQLWDEKFNGIGNGPDAATALTVDAAGNSYVTGYSRVSGSNSEWVTIKHDTDGHALWKRRYNPSADYNSGTAITLDSSGNVIVTGFGNFPSTGRDIVTIKYTADGAKLWTKRYNGPAGNNTPYAIATDSSGNIFVSGYDKNSAGNWDYLTIKYGSDGARLWTKTYNGAGNGNDLVRAMALDASGNVYVTGSAKDVAQSWDIVTIKYDTNGKMLWRKTFSGPADLGDVGNAITTDSAGNVYVTGFATRSDNTVVYETLKYDTNGALQWQKHVDVYQSDNEASAIAVDASGNVYVTGSVFTGVGSGGDTDYYTVKYDANGHELWASEWNGPGHDQDQPLGLVLNPMTGDVIVTGWTTLHNGMGDTAWATVWYSADDGAQLRTEIARGTAAYSLAYPAGIGMDASGNVYVTGSADDAATGTDYMTVKYAP